MNDKKQIEEIRNDIFAAFGGYAKWEEDWQSLAEALYNAGYRKQSVGEWEWFEEWSPSTTDHPRECDDCGWRCGKCKTALEDVVGGYWDDPDKKPNLNFCPNCGAKMKGGAE